MASSTTIVAVLTVALLVATTRLAEGQADCASKLVPCAEYLNSTKPSAECCNAMKEVVTTQLSCLCGLIKNPSLLGGINMTQALELPKYCNIPGDTSACNAALAPTSSNPPPAVPGGSGGTNAGRRISWMGMPAVLLVSALTFFY
ncbi:hypothetical protein ACS0TY_021637 [Phlomoides rotata]